MQPKIFTKYQKPIARRRPINRKISSLTRLMAFVGPSNKKQKTQKIDLLSLPIWVININRCLNANTHENANPFNNRIPTLNLKLNFCRSVSFFFFSFVFATAAVAAASRWTVSKRRAYLIELVCLERKCEEWVSFGKSYGVAWISRKNFIA